MALAKVVLAAALPIAFLPSLIDAFVLPRAAIVVAGACLGAGLALLIPGKPGLGNMRLPLVLAAAGAVLAFAFSVSWPLSLAGGYTRYESLPVRLAYLGLLALWCSICAFGATFRSGSALSWTIPSRSACCQPCPKPAP